MRQPSSRNEHLFKPKVSQIPRYLDAILQILLHNHRSRLGEELIYLLEGLVLGLGHEEDLVEPAENGDTAIEAQRETDSGHGVHHSGEIVGDDERAEEEVCVRGRHAVAAEVGGEGFTRDDPGKSSNRFVSWECG